MIAIFYSFLNIIIAIILTWFYNNRIIFNASFLQANYNKFLVKVMQCDIHIEIFIRELEFDFVEHVILNVALYRLDLK